MGGHLRYDARVSHRVLHLRPGLLQPRDHVRLSVSRYEVIIYESRVSIGPSRSSFRGNNVENNARAGIGSASLKIRSWERRISFFPVSFFFLFLNTYRAFHPNRIDIKLNCTSIFDTLSLYFKIRDQSLFFEKWNNYCLIINYIHRYNYSKKET